MTFYNDELPYISGIFVSANRITEKGYFKSHTLVKLSEIKSIDFPEKEEDHEKFCFFYTYKDHKYHVAMDAFELAKVITDFVKKDLMS